MTDYGIECGNGWSKIIQETDAKLRYIDPNYKIDQIKEKFGGLRYYFSTDIGYDNLAYQIMNDIVKSAELQCDRTCEKCGADGYKDGVENRSLNYWYFTYCLSCYADTLETRYQRRESNDSNRA